MMCEGALINRCPRKCGTFIAHSWVLSRPLIAPRPALKSSAISGFVSFTLTILVELSGFGKLCVELAANWRNSAP
jgi:hypothetical protein